LSRRTRVERGQLQGKRRVLVLPKSEPRSSLRFWIKGLPTPFQRGLILATTDAPKTSGSVTDGESAALLNAATVLREEPSCTVQQRGTLAVRHAPDVFGASVVARIRPRWKGFGDPLIQNRNELLRFSAHKTGTRRLPCNCLGSTRVRRFNSAAPYPPRIY